MYDSAMVAPPKTHEHFHEDSEGRRTKKSKNTIGTPSDRLTRDAWYKLNGDLEVSSLDRPMSWKEFKALADEEKRRYVDMLRERFGVSNNGLAEMFGITTAGICDAFKRYGIKAAESVSRQRDVAGFRAWAGLSGEKQKPETRSRSRRPEAEAGELEITGDVLDIFDAVRRAIGRDTVKMVIRWTPIRLEE